MLASAVTSTISSLYELSELQSSCRFSEMPASPHRQLPVLLCKELHFQGALLVSGGSVECWRFQVLLDSRSACSHPSADHVQGSKGWLGDLQRTELAKAPGAAPLMRPPRGCPGVGAGVELDPLLNTSSRQNFEAFAQGSGVQPLPNKEVTAQAMRGKSGCQ